MKSTQKQPAELERAQFAERLAVALAARGMPVNATALQRAFNAQNPVLAISVHADASGSWVNPYPRKHACGS